MTQVVGNQVDQKGTRIAKDPGLSTSVQNHAVVRQDDECFRLPFLERVYKLSRQKNRPCRPGPSFTERGESILYVEGPLQCVDGVHTAGMGRWSEIRGRYEFQEPIAFISLVALRGCRNLLKVWPQGRLDDDVVRGLDNGTNAAMEVDRLGESIDEGMEANSIVGKGLEHGVDAQERSEQEPRDACLLQVLLGLK